MQFENQITQIVGTSSYINDVISNPFNFLRLIVNVTKNCCGDVLTDMIDLTYLLNTTTMYGTSINYRNVSGTFNIKVVDIKYINTQTGLVFSINTINRTNYITLTNTSFTANTQIITDATNAFLNANFTVSAALTSVGDDTGATLLYTVANLPPSFLPYSITIIDNNTTLETTYAFLLSNNGIQENVAYISPQGLYLSNFFLQNTLDNVYEGVYTIQVVYVYRNGTTITEQSCIFIDSSMKCLIVANLCNFNSQDQVSLLMYHYSLTEGSNCDCNNCNYLCQLYKEAYKMLNLVSGSNVNTNCPC